MTTDFSALMFSAIALLIVLSLAWFTLKSMGMFLGRVKSGRQIEILENQIISGRERLVLAKYADNEYLIGVSQQGVVLLEKNDVQRRQEHDSVVARVNDTNLPDAASNR